MLNERNFEWNDFKAIVELFVVIMGMSGKFWCNYLKYFFDQIEIEIEILFSKFLFLEYFFGAFRLTIII
jgi:hypothetical protein